MLSWLREALNLGWRNRQDEDEDDDDLLSLGDPEDHDIEYQWRSGTVTRVEEAYYLIDDTLYWPKDLHFGDSRLASQSRGEVKVGNKVRSKLSRKGEHEEWKVVEVQDDQDDEGSNLVLEWSKVKK